MTLAVAVHKAVHDALINGSESELAAFIAGRVFDRVPTKPAPEFPYIEIGAIDIRDDATTCINSSEVSVTVHIWSNTVGSIEAKRIGGLVRKVLAPDDQSIVLPIEDHATVVAAFDVEVYRPGGNPLLTEGVLSFTYLVDPLNS